MPHPRSHDTADPVLAELRKIVAELPGTREVEAWGKPTFRVGLSERTLKIFAVLGGHRAGPNSAAEIPVPKALLVKPDPSERKALEEDTRFFVPAYWVGKGWLAFDLDTPDVDWSEVVELVEDSYRQNAPKTLVADLDQRRAD